MNWEAGFLKGTIFGLLGGALFGLLPHGQKIRTMETLRTDWFARVRKDPLQLLLGSGVAAVLVGLPGALAGGTLFGVCIGALTGVLFLLFYPIPNEVPADPPAPNRGIWRSLRLALVQTS